MMDGKDTAEIRRATSDDTAGLTACITAAYAPFLRQGLHLPPVAEGIAEDIRDHHVWAATMAGDIVGGVVLVLGETAHLANLAVHPHAAGHGIGRALIDTAAATAGAGGYCEIGLATHSKMTATQAFYRKLGWHETGSDGDKVYFTLQLPKEMTP